MIVPGTSVLNFTPSVTALSGPESGVVGTAALGKAVTGFGVGVLGVGVLGAGVVGAGVVGAGVLGAGVLGVGVLGAGVLGVGVLGAGGAGGGELTVKTTPIVEGVPVLPLSVTVIVLVYVPAARPLGFSVTVTVLGVDEAVPAAGATESQDALVETV